MRGLRHLSAPACSFDDGIDRAIHDQVNQTIFGMPTTRPSTILALIA